MSHAWPPPPHLARLVPKGDSHHLAAGLGPSRLSHPRSSYAVSPPCATPSPMWRRTRGPGSRHTPIALEWDEAGAAAEPVCRHLRRHRRCAPHLTYYTCAATPASVASSWCASGQVYRDAGPTSAHEEPPGTTSAWCWSLGRWSTPTLPESCCVITASASSCSSRSGQRDSGLAAGRRGLPHHLPTLDGTDEEALARLIAEGPPMNRWAWRATRSTPQPTPRADRPGATIPVGVTAS